jgi:2-phosphoglycerate kinase
MEQQSSVPFTVMLIGGPSGVGKSVVGAAIGRQLGIPWLQIDDIRLALQFSGLVPPEHHPALFSFLDPKERIMPPEIYRDRLIAVGRILSGALRIVIESHIATAVPIVIEGDGILPEFAAAMCEQFPAGAIRTVFIIENDADRLLANARARGRGIDRDAADALGNGSRAAALYSRWLQREAQRYGLPAISPLPWDTLPQRILAV